MPRFLWLLQEGGKFLMSEVPLKDFGFRVQGSEFRVQCSGFRVQGSGFRVQGAGCRVQGVGFPPLRSSTLDVGRGGFTWKMVSSPLFFMTLEPTVQ